MLQKVFKELPHITDAGYTGYGAMNAQLSTDEPLSFGAIFLQPNGTNATFIRAFEKIYEISRDPGVSGLVVNFDFPSWSEYTNAFVQDPNIATNIIDGSRLLTSEVLLKRTDDLIDLVLAYPDNGPGFNFSKCLLRQVLILSPLDAN